MSGAAGGVSWCWCTDKALCRQRRPLWAKTPLSCCKTICRGPPEHEKPAMSQTERNKVAPDSLTRARSPPYTEAQGWAGDGQLRSKLASRFCGRLVHHQGNHSVSVQWCKVWNTHSLSQENVFGYFFQIPFTIVMWSKSEEQDKVLVNSFTVCYCTSSPRSQEAGKPEQVSHSTVGQSVSQLVIVSQSVSCNHL